MLVLFLYFCIGWTIGGAIANAFVKKYNWEQFFINLIGEQLWPVAVFAIMLRYLSIA